MSDWEEQYRRILRGLARIKNQDRSQEEYEDDLWCFFINCWHLKDWLKQDAFINVNVTSDIEKEAENSGILQYCRTVADKRKHLRLSRFHPKDAQPIAAFDVSTADETVTVRWHIEKDDGTSVPVVQFAESIVYEWSRILRAYGLIGS